MSKRGGFCAATVIGLFFAAGLQADVLAGTSFRDWSGEKKTTELDDGSVVTEYVANTVAQERADALLEVVFLPRFECTPLIGVRIDASTTDNSAQTQELLKSLQLLDDGDRLSMLIDEKSILFPIVVDQSKDQAALWYGVERQDRETLSLQMDGGDKALIALSTNTTLRFSLLGSRKSMRAVKESCQKHEPVPYTPR